MSENDEKGQLESTSEETELWCKVGAAVSGLANPTPLRAYSVHCGVWGKTGLQQPAEVKATKWRGQGRGQGLADSAIKVQRSSRQGQERCNGPRQVGWKPGQYQELAGHRGKRASQWAPRNTGIRGTPAGEAASELTWGGCFYARTDRR